MGSTVGIAYYKKKPGVALDLSFSFESQHLTVKSRFTPVTHSSLQERKKRKGAKKGRRLAEASRNGRPRREESGGSVKGISAASQSGKVEKLFAICHKGLHLNKLGGFLLKLPST